MLIAWLHSQMSNYLKKFTENTAFGTTELYRYCGLNYVKVAKMQKNIYFFIFEVLWEDLSKQQKVQKEK